jgi:hypothetical protein
MKSNLIRSAWLTALASFLVAVPVRADVVVLTFEGVGNDTPVGNFYNGGAGGNFGISFSNNGLGIIDSDAGGTGNIGGEPSPSTVLYFLSGGAATMNVAAGFDTGFSFYYSAIVYTGFVNVYDGVDGSGNLLAHIDLSLTPYGGAPDPNGAYSPFVPIGVSFNGVAKSVDFGGTADYIAFDNITLGASVPGGVPDGASTLALMAFALTTMAALRRKLHRS